MKNIFSGRINRYSWFLSLIIVSLLNGIYQDNLFGHNTIVGIITIFAYFFAVIMCIKRYHDLNKSGWRIFIIFVPFFNIYWAFKLLFGAGDFGENKYGPAPAKGTKFF